MDPVSIIKRKRHQPDEGGCYFCQSNSGQLRTASTDGKARTKSVAAQRRKLGDNTYIDVIERLELISEADFNAQEVWWHKACYSTFSSESKLERLRKHRQVSPATSESVNCDDVSSIPSPPKRRSSEPAINWSLCMFCQMESKVKVHRVQTLGKSKEIIERSKSDPVMRTRLSGVSDLIAAEGCYHLPCLVTFDRQSKQNSGPQAYDECMIRLCNNLCSGLSRGHVYDMGNIWDSYNSMCSGRGTCVPQRYKSRRTTFYNDVQKLVGNKASFVRPLSNRALLMYPGEESNFLISQTLKRLQECGMDLTESESTEDEDDCNIEVSKDNIFQEMVHVALRVRQDLLDTPGHSNTWQGIDKEHVDKVIPNSLYLFLSLLFGGINMKYEEYAEETEEDNTVKEAVCNIAQDIVYAVSKGRKLTPKHIGLGLALHQASRSEGLVELFHAANHTIGIDTVRRFDTSIAESILQRFKENGNVYVPDNIAKERFMQFSCDNIDVLEATLDGKNTFHCTQLMVWQRGPAPQQSGSNSNCIHRSRAVKIDALKEFHKLHHAKLPSKHRPLQSYSGENKIELEWFSNCENDERLKSWGKDLGWILSRMHDDEVNQTVPSWRAQNEITSIIDPPITTAAILPILQAPADDNDTLTTVIIRFMEISKKMGQKYTVITADQPLYSRGKELVWGNPDFENVIFIMGGLHICFNFLKAIGQHMNSAGLDDLWTETGVYATNTIESMLNGKAYYRAVRGHQLTYEALWFIKWPMFEVWLGENDHVVKVKELSKNVTALFQKKGDSAELNNALGQLSEVLSSKSMQDLMSEFNKMHSSNSNFMLWSTYLEMVQILLDFIRAARDGNWALYLEAFAEMLPWLTIYDHNNYARWGPIYLADMKLLQKTAPEVYAEFINGNFVVKRTNRRFNQVPVDQATEWMNRTCKMHNGIIGITRNDQARDKFCITWSERSRISQNTRSLFNLEDDEDDTPFTRSDSLPSRMKRDSCDVKKLITQLNIFDVFRVDTRVDTEVESASETNYSSLVSIATKDIAPTDIASDLLTAQDRGKKHVTSFVKQRLIDEAVPFYDPIQKHHSKTFGDMYKVTVTTKKNVQKSIKADRKLMQRLFNVVSAGRPVDMANILKHELSPYPFSLAKIGGEMNSTPKADMIGVLMDGLSILSEVPHAELKACVLIDGHALIQALGKPTGCQTFGEYSDVFMKAVTRYFGGHTSRVDVVFDRYIGEGSIKVLTRAKRVSKKKPIRKLIEGNDVPLPQVWSQFIALDENKADLARYLSEIIINKGKDLPEQYELVTGGGFSDATQVRSTRRDNVEIRANHEEADTRLILHSREAINKGYERLLVICKDTDVMLLLIHFFQPKTDVWMIAGTAKKYKCYPIHAVYERLTQDVRDNLLSFHAFTGCDTTSSFFGHGKKSCWKTFLNQPLLLQGVGRDGELAPIEQFVCHLYGTRDQETIDHARLQLFRKAKKDVEILPPTRDALTLHTIRANYQAKIWLQADKEHINISSPTDTTAWKMDSECLKAVWTTLPAIPKACVELVTCGCKSKCSTVRCSCFLNDFTCTPACECDAIDCCNPCGQQLDL